MNQIPEALTNMLAAWNERDLDEIRSFIDKSLAEDIVFADPSNFVRGRDDFEEMVREFRTNYPGSVCRRTSGVNSHNNRYHYEWEIEQGQKILIKGTDFVKINEAGLVETVDGFFGELQKLDY
jgi:nuclear transport factor 2 (NTF2) superfamily protein